MQTVADGDMRVEAKFDSQVSQLFQQQGIVVEENSTRSLDVEIVQNWFETAVVATSVSGSAPTTELDVEIYNKPSSRAACGARRHDLARELLLRRVPLGDRRHLHRHPRSGWVGVFAGNFGDEAAPGFTATVDYFVDPGSPPATDDGAPWPSAPSKPVIHLWYGSSQTFGARGQPQAWDNVLGDVSDPAGIGSLSYSLNRRRRSRPVVG